MEVLVEQINRGMLVVSKEGKGVLEVRDIVELESFPPKYKLYFVGITNTEIYLQGTKLQVMPNQE